MRPLRRSPYFWLGIIPGLFLVWSWVDSLFYERYASALFPGRSLVVGHHLGRGGVIILESPRVAGDFTFTSRRIAPELERPIFPGPEWKVTAFGSASLPAKQSHLYIPHWMLLSVWVVLFLIALDVRQKIIQVKTELPDEDAPSSDH